MKTGCGSCRFWDERMIHREHFGDKIALATCVRRSPAPPPPNASRADPTAVWPITREDDWCGNFARATEHTLAERAEIVKQVLA